MSGRVVVVGTSVGGVSAAQALRAEGYEGEIVLVGEEDELPYDKPPLSKGLLAGSADVEHIRLLTPQQADEYDFELLLGRRAVHLGVAEKRVHLQGHQPVDFDHLVIATGARARPSPWRPGPGVHVLRTLADSLALRADLLAGGPVVVVGGGFIGAEVASTARAMNLDVTIVDPLPVPMSRLLNPEVGRWFAEVHRRHGVRTIFGQGVGGIEGERGAFAVRLTDGRALPAATVVVGIGAEPNDDWLRDSGLLVEDGVVCDEYCRAVDAKDIYAVGDVARWLHAERGVSTRAEHWTNAVEQARCVAHNLMHPDDLQAFGPSEYVWSDQHDWKIQVAGRTGDRLEHVLIGHPEDDGRFAVLYAATDQRLIGVVAVNWSQAFVHCRRALRSGADVGMVRHKLEALQRDSAAAARS